MFHKTPVGNSYRDVCLCFKESSISSGNTKGAAGAMESGSRVDDKLQGNKNDWNWRIPDEQRKKMKEVKVHIVTQLCYSHSLN